MIDDATKNWLGTLRFRTFHDHWARDGRQLYELGHSIAAALTATRSPALQWAHCPRSTFAIKIPVEFLPLPERTHLDHYDLQPGAPALIAVLSTPTLRAVSLLAEQRRGGYAEVSHVTAYGEFVQPEFPRENDVSRIQRPGDNAFTFEMRLALRVASNTVAYVTAYRDALTVKSVQGEDRPRVIFVGAPKDVSIDRAFRDQVRELVAARTVPRARGVLAHLVRGHWKRQCGKLIWISPYRRGDENIGRVVERIDRL